jgi:hypothetical protein
VLPIDVPVADVPFEEEVVVPVFGEAGVVGCAEAEGAGVFAEVPAMVEDWLDVVASVLGDFLSFFMSPRASAELLASATIVVSTKAGASLRIWSS